MENEGNETKQRVVFVPPGWADFYEETHIPAAVKVGDTLRLTGHTGETADGVFSAEPDSQIRQTFRNIALTLAEGKATWSDVVELNSHHVGLRSKAEAPSGSPLTSWKTHIRRGQPWVLQNSSCRKQ